ncbi:hypothetical protein PT974_11208 [Cladobotryum mycophilum]|uniref:Uncharacterized protein n=1 Tax=Cladobotryum mycophilum TaxID=491253 RepID=A0ABR0S5N6_9HYPO
MTAPPAGPPPPTTTTTTTTTTTRGSPVVDAAGHRQFKKHKLLPHPPPPQQNDRGRDNQRRTPRTSQLSINTTSTAYEPPANHEQHQPPSPQTLKHQLKRIGTGPDLPPTPQPTRAHLPALTPSCATPPPTVKRPPATPPDQRSPPTPDVTPPQPANLAKALRPNMRDRGPSSLSNMAPDSRTESFKTAREEVTSSSSEDESGRSAVRPTVASTASQATVRAPGAVDRGLVQSPALGVSLRKMTGSPEPRRTPSSKGEFKKFDGNWSPGSRNAREEDERLQRTMNSMKRKPLPKQPQANGNRNQVIEDVVVVQPTNAAKAVRQMPLKKATEVSVSPKRAPVQKPERMLSVPSKPTRPKSQTIVQRAPSAPSKPMRSDSQTTMNSRKASNASMSSASNVVEAFLVDGPPHRQRTLRHVRKQSALRDPILNGPDSVVDRVDLNQSPKPPRIIRSTVFSDANSRHESVVSALSNTTSRSISSNRARREIWKSGAIPVVIVPDRKSSRGPKSREPSLRSTSSKHSKRTGSSVSTPIGTPARNSGPVFERPARRSRRYSESDRSDQRTVDFPPVIPARSSSLSAPTSRNVSRAASTKSKSSSVKSRADTQPRPRSKPEPKLEPESQPIQGVHIISPSPPLGEAPLSPDTRELEPADAHDSLGFDRYDEPLSPRKFSSRNTPFSVISMETFATAAELSEALAIHMYPHQNSSVLVVNNSGRPSDVSDKQREAEPPKITRTSPTENIPVTPPQTKVTLQDVESPLRNPRAPPQPPKYPPAINLIPATPSGSTPAHERAARQGNYFESLNERPPRRIDMVKRALSRRRHSVDLAPAAGKAPGFLTRTFSLSRNTRKGTHGDEEKDNADVDLKDDDKPAEGNKLHPLWRPQWSSDEQSDLEEVGRRGDVDRDEDEVYRYPPVDNRPRVPMRSFSARVKRTFAILPTEEYAIDDMYGPQRRTIRRTPSGNLRVMRRRSSAESFGRSRSPRGKQTPPISRPRRGIWRSQSLNRADSLKRRFSIGSKLEEIQNIPQMISERRREKRSQQLRQMISGPKEVRDGVGEVIRRGNAGVQSTVRQF